jgi:3-oxoacyl-[acyl-carrier-protein] synthase II
LNNLLSGKSGIDLIKSFDTKEFLLFVRCGEILDFDASLYLPQKEIQRMDRFCQFGVIAFIIAYSAAKINLTDE